MKRDELIALLQTLPADADVRIGHEDDYGMCFGNLITVEDSVIYNEPGRDYGYNKYHSYCTTDMVPRTVYILRGY